MPRSALLIFLLLVFAFSAFAQKFPLVTQIKQISQFPAEIPHRVNSMAYDGKKLWFGIYLNEGHYATFDLRSNKWEYSNSPSRHQVIRQVAKPFASASGMFFVDKKLWLSSDLSETFGYINLRDWGVGKSFRQTVRSNLPNNTQFFADIAFDGKNIWLVWHSHYYEIPAPESQLLVKVNPDTGEILEKYPLPIGTRGDGTHGLTFDGAVLWHIKDKNLVAIDLNGKVIGRFEINELKRPSGIAWDGKSFWIVEFDGKLWQLPVGK